MLGKVPCRWWWGVLGVFWCWAGHAWAQESLIREIMVEGTSELETSQILFSLESAVNEPLDRVKISRDLKTIYNKGMFQDVRAEVEPVNKGYRLRLVVVERPRIQEITWEGRRSLPQSDFDDKLSVKQNDIYDVVKVKENEVIIREVYRKAGYTTARVTQRAEKINDQRYRVIFIVDETPKVYLTDIEVKGTKVFSELEIKRFILSAEIDCFSWASDSGIFQEEKVNQDMALIAQHYLRLGYIKVFIEKPKVILYRNPEYGRLEVKMKIQEGDQYFVGKVDISGDILGEKEKLLKTLKLKPEEVYNPFLQNEDRSILNELYQEQGYAFVRVIPRTEIHEETRRVDVTYDIVKNEKAYIGRIEFSGNTETRDFVIRREFTVKEGELYNGKKLRESQENLERLGFFEAGFTLDKKPLDQEDNVLDIVTRLKEAQTGTFQAQLGYSEVSKISGGVSISKGNLFGRGQTLRLNAQFAQEGVTNEYSLTYIEPRVLSSNVSSTLSVSQSIREDVAEQGRGTILENAYAISAGVPIYRRWRFSTRLSAVDRLFQKTKLPSVVKRSLAPTISYNDVNSPTFPSQGVDTSFSVIQTGGGILGGNTTFREYNFDYQQFWSLNQDRTLVLMAHSRLGWLERTGRSQIPLEDRYRIGGISTVRGHDPRAIAGPYSGGSSLKDREIRTIFGENGSREISEIDKRTRNLSFEELRKLKGGGIAERIFNVELLFPMTSDEKSNVRGVIFYDAGNVNAESEQYELLKEKEPGFFDLRHSAGAGVRVITPVGVLRFEYGQKLDRLPGEEPDKFEFNISGLF